jgi:hypothetical protein
VALGRELPLLLLLLPASLSRPKEAICKAVICHSAAV